MTNYWRNNFVLSQTVTLSSGPALIMPDLLGLSHQMLLSADVDLNLSSHLSLIQKFNRPVDLVLATTFTIDQSISNHPIVEDDLLEVADTLSLIDETPYSDSLEIEQSIQFIGDLPLTLSSNLSLDDSLVRL